MRDWRECRGSALQPDYTAESYWTEAATRTAAQAMRSARTAMRLAVAGGELTLASLAIRLLG